MTDPVISELEKALNDARRQKLNRTGDSEDDGSSSGSGKNSFDSNEWCSSFCVGLKHIEFMPTQK